MRRGLIGFLVAILAVVMLAHPVLADIYGIWYNFNAAENEWALKVGWIGRPPFEIKANEFYSQKVKGQLETIADVEARIQEKFNDLLVEDTKLSTIEADDEVRQDPPVLAPWWEIIIKNNQEYLRVHKAYFRIHIYSLDDLETPESELEFLTRFQQPWAGQIPDDWWSEW